jgi:signal transduction histidine kinase
MANAPAHQIDPAAVRANKLDVLERLADDLAHEIKNPLHSMVINLEVLKRRISRTTPEGASELLRYAEIISGELDRVNGRIEILLQLVRPDRAGESVSLAAAVHELLPLLELERGRGGVRIEYPTEPQPLRGRIPRETARQLVLDLLLVALDATPRGGTIRIATESYEDTERLAATLSAPADGEEKIRVDPSRLAVARALATALGGGVEAGGAGEDVTSLLLSLPSATGWPDAR